MAADPARNWSPSQQARLDDWGVARAVDVHCHCLPELDDGPRSLKEALRLCQALVADGITTVIATPHQLGGYDRLNNAAVVRDAVAQLNDELVHAGIPLDVTPGGDVRVDERLTRLLDTDQVLTCADAGRAMLLELPHELFVDPLSTIDELEQRGVQAIMTHPERHRYLVGAPRHAEAWIAHGAALQITAGSLLGDFGPTANQEAWRLLHAGMVSLVATDAHDALRRPPRLSAALQVVTRELGYEIARTICLDNPLRVLRGEPLEPCHAD